MRQGLKVFGGCMSALVATVVASGLPRRRHSLVGALAFIAAYSIASGAAFSAVPGYGQWERDVASFARQHDVSLPEARERLSWQRRAPDLSEDAHRRLGETFGGLWIDSAGQIALGVTTPSAVPDAEAAARANDLSDGVDVTRVPHSYSALERISAWLGTRLQAANDAADIPLSYGIRPDLSVVSISRPNDDRATAGQIRLIEDAKERFGDAITVDFQARRLELLACSYPYCTPPLRAGIRNGPAGIFIPNDPDSGACTAAFITRGRGADSANLYQLTAGHCAFNGNWGTMLSPSGPVQTIGPWQNAYVGPSGDAGKYLIADNSYRNAKPWVYWAGYSESYPIYSDADPIQGQSLCASGAYSGTTSCGTVTQVTHTTGSGQSLVRANYCSGPGDSGGPVHYYGTAHGLITGGYSACDSVFTRISAAENVMNVDVVHAAAPLNELRNSHTSGPPDYDAFRITGQRADDKPVAGDWNGDGYDTVGFFRPSTAMWYLKNSNTTGSADLVFQYGNPGDRPVVGDWNEDNIDTVGVYRSNGAFYLRNFNSAGTPQYGFGFGNSEDLPVAGDWNNSGTDTVGVYRPSNGVFYLGNTNATVVPDYSFAYGNPGNNDLPVAGDWDENGYFSVGVFRQSTGQWFLDNEVPGNQPISYIHSFGTWGSTIPIVGDWNNSGTDTAGSVNPY